MARFRPLVIVLAMALFATAAFAATWNHAVIVDTTCATRAKADPAAHPVSCALQCAAKGLGIYTAGGQFLKLDAAGTQAAIAILKNSHKKADVQVVVVGERHGDTIAVQSIRAL